MRILLIEDDKKAADLLSRAFREEGFLVDVMHSAEAGDEQSSHVDYGLIVIDWLLPGKSGLALCKEWRGRGVQVPILMLTARDAVSDRVLGLDSGIDDYLTKPFALEEVLARARALLRRSETMRPPQLEIGDLRLDSTTQQASRAGKPLDLTRTEFLILQLLMRRPGTVITRAQLADHVWQQEVNSIDSIIDVHISNLRRKLDAGREKSMLQTLRGRGYRLVMEE